MWTAVEQCVVTGSTTAITCQHLLVRDDDTPPDHIVYTLLSRPTNGDVMAGDTHLNIVSNFTQRDIDNRLVVFRHQGLAFLLALVAGGHKFLILSASAVKKVYE